MPLEVLEARTEHGLIFVHWVRWIEIIDYALNESHGFWVTHFGLDAHTRQNQNLSQVLGSLVLVLSGQNVEAVDLFSKGRLLLLL